MLPREHTMYSKVKCREDIRCADFIEVPYYVAANIGRVDLCCVCGGEGGVKPEDLVQKYKTVLPICDGCKSQGIQTVAMRPKPTKNAHP